MWGSRDRWSKRCSAICQRNRSYDGFVAGDRACFRLSMRADRSATYFRIVNEEDGCPHQISDAWYWPRREAKTGESVFSRTFSARAQEGLKTSTPLPTI